MKRQFLLTILLGFTLMAFCQTENITTSFKKSFAWGACAIDENLDGEFDADNDTFFTLPSNSRVVLDFKHFGSAGSRCKIEASYPDKDGSGMIELEPVRLEDVKIIKLGTDFLVVNALGDTQISLIYNETEHYYCLFIDEPALFNLR